MALNNKHFLIRSINKLINQSVNQAICCCWNWPSYSSCLIMFVEEVDNPETRATLGTRHRTKPKNTKYTTQNTKNMSNTDSTKNGGEPMWSEKVRNSCFLLDIRRVTHSQIRWKILSVIEKRTKLHAIKIHCRLRNGYFVTVNQFLVITV